MRERSIAMYVPPKFKKMVKIEAAKKGKTVISYLREVEKSTDPLNEIAKKYKRGFDFV